MIRSCSQGSDQTESDAMQYISIDIETTGTDPLVHDIIEFAAVIDRTESETPFD